MVGSADFTAWTDTRDPMDESTVESAVSEARPQVSAGLTAPTARRKYAPPMVTAFGSVEDFTRQGGSQNFDRARTTKNRG